MEHSHHLHPHGEPDIQPESHQHHHSPAAQDAHAGHDKHAGHHTHDFLKRFWICLVITAPVLLLSPMIQQWLGFELKFAGDKYVFELDGVKTMMPRGSNTPTAEGYLLFPYFGGDETAPHDIVIWMKAETPKQ